MQSNTTKRSIKNDHGEEFTFKYGEWYDKEDHIVRHDKDNVYLRIKIDGVTYVVQLKDKHLDVGTYADTFERIVCDNVYDFDVDDMLNRRGKKIVKNTNNKVEKIKTGYYISLCYQKRVIGYDDKDGDWFTHLFVKNANALFNISNFTAEESEAFCFSSKEEAEDYIDENYLKLLSMGSLTSADIWHTDGIDWQKYKICVPKVFACDKDDFFDDVRTNLKREVERLEKYCNRKGKTMTYDELYSHMLKYIQHLNAGYCFSGIRNNMRLCGLTYGQIGDDVFPLFSVGFTMDIGHERCKNYLKLNTVCILPLFEDTEENIRYFKDYTCAELTSNFVHSHDGGVNRVLKNGETVTIAGIDEAIAVARTISFPMKK